MSHVHKHFIPHIIFLILGILVLELIGKSVLIVSIYAFAIVIGALMLSWAAESAEIIIPEGLALALVAWLQVLPEFTIEATIAWARDIPNLLANFTGANRVLIGIGWPIVFFTTIFFYWKRHKKFYGEIKLKAEHSVEVIFLFFATIYFFFVYLTKKITIIDSVILIILYILYLRVISKLPHESRKRIKELYGGVPKRIMNFKKNEAKLAIILLFICGGGLIWIVAGPFYKGMLALSATLGVSQFLFIQWIAPFLSEFPEKTSAFYWASKIKTAPVAMMNLISSQVTQWTVLVAMIPIVLSIAVGSLDFLPLSGFLNNELMLTIATSLFASVFLMKLRINIFEISSLLVLWVVQLIFVQLRATIIFVYLGLIILEIIIYKKEMLNAFRAFKDIIREFVI